MSPTDSTSTVFDQSYYAATALQKIRRALQLGPKYFFWDLPRYLRHRRRFKLPIWDVGVFLNPLREFRGTVCQQFPLPPGYRESLNRLAHVGVRVALPPQRLQALLGAWWAAREIRGDVIECGAYRGATSLMLAVLGQANNLSQIVFALDTFRGTPDPSPWDCSRKEGEFALPPDHVAVMRQQVAALALEDRIEIHQGLFSETLARLHERSVRFAFAHIDANLYQSTWEACQFTVPRLSPGGIVVFDDYNGVCDLGARLAIDRYFAGTVHRPIPLCGSSAYLRHSGPALDS